MEQREKDHISFWCKCDIFLYSILYKTFCFVIALFRYYFRIWWIKLSCLDFWWQVCKFPIHAQRCVLFYLCICIVSLSKSLYSFHKQYMCWMLVQRYVILGFLYSYSATPTPKYEQFELAHEEILRVSLTIHNRDILSCHMLILQLSWHPSYNISCTVIRARP